MFKPVVVSEQQFAQKQGFIAEADVKWIFRVLHGSYGNPFLSKFSTGVVVNAEDQGIANAISTWAQGLREFDAETIQRALNNCQTRHTDYPPNLPQFVALCNAAKPRQIFDSGPKAVEMSQPVRSAYAEVARNANRQHTKPAGRMQTGESVLPEGLEGLKRAIASATAAAAGGDEARELLRLDRMLAATGSG